MAKTFEPERPDELVQRYSSELARMAAKLPMPPHGQRSVVDTGNAQQLLERAIREAWGHGGAHSLAMAPPQKIVLQYPTDSPIAEVCREWARDFKADGGM